MLAIKRSAGVVPQVNLNNPLHAGHKARKWEIGSGFEIQDQKSKTRVTVVSQKVLMSSNIKTRQKQEYIPVGCVPFAAVAVWFGGVSARGLSAQGVSAWRGGGLVLLDTFVNISLQDWLFISMLRLVDNWNLAVLPTPASILPFQNMINTTSQLYW